MADQSKLEQMLEKLVNNDREGADQLFHEFVIEKSRGIYEEMLESELKDLEVDEATDEEVDEATDEEVDESSDDEETNEATDEEVDEATDEEVDENFDEFTPEADPMPMDATGDLEDEMDGDEEGEMDMDNSDDDMEDRVVDLEDALDDLKAEFEKMMSGDDKGDMDDEDMGDEDDDDDGEEAEEESFDNSELSVEDEAPAFEGKKTAGEQMREYVEKVATPKGEDNKATSPVASANKMGGTAGNIAQGGDETGGKAAAAKDMGRSFENEPGAKASKSMKNAKAPAKGESGANTKSTIGS